MNTDQENLINDSNNSYSTNSHELVGGRNQKWKNVLETICQRYAEQKLPHQDVGDMGELAYVKQNLDVEKLKNPIYSRSK